MRHYPRSHVLVYQGIDDGFDDFTNDPGWAAIMDSNCLDRPAVLVKVDNSIIQSLTKVPHCEVFQVC